MANRGFAPQPCCMAGTKDSFSYGKRSSFLCKTFSLFLPCNMAAVQNLYSHYQPSWWNQIILLYFPRTQHHSLFGNLPPLFKRIEASGNKDSTRWVESTQLPTSSPHWTKIWLFNVQILKEFRAALLELSPNRQKSDPSSLRKCVLLFYMCCTVGWMDWKSSTPS